jgi:cell division protease FtsH
VDAETRRLVEEALAQATALLSAHRTTLDRLAERLCEHETVNGSEVTAMLELDSTMAQGTIAAESPASTPSATIPPGGIVGKTGSKNGDRPRQMPAVG